MARGSDKGLPVDDLTWKRLYPIQRVVTGAVMGRGGFLWRIMGIPGNPSALTRPVAGESE